MHRTVRVFAAFGLTVGLSMLSGAGLAGAQEMEHGRTRPASREVQTNQVKTQTAIANGFTGYIRG